MKPWVPGQLATRRLVALAFGGFALMLAIAIALQFAVLELPIDALLFTVTPIAFVVTWPAVGVISARVEYEKPKLFELSRKTWRVHFDGTPMALALGAILYFYVVFAWLYFTDTFEPRVRAPAAVPSDWFVGFFAVPSVFSLISAAILVGHARNGAVIGHRV